MSSRAASLREEIVLNVMAKMAGGGLSQAAACALVGVKAPSFVLWRDLWKQGGIGALEPRTDNCGNAEKFVLTEEEAAALRGHVLRKQSFPLAVEDFANDMLNCKPGTRALIVEELARCAAIGKQPVWPLSLRRAGQVTSEEMAIFRGEKHFQGERFSQRRGMYLIDEEGESVEIGPNSIWESDDMSQNEPFHFTDPESGELRVGRQTLLTADVFADKFLGATPLGRAKDGYRVEDIADHMREMVQQWGLPLAWRLERGPWENNFIDGILVPGRGDKRWGGLCELIHIARAFSSGAKGTIESSFDLLQSLLAHESLSIGRSRGEFELATKAMRRANDPKLNRKDQEAAALKFWGIAKSADAVAAAMCRFNARGKVRRAFGKGTVVPDELYAGPTGAGPRKRECAAEDLWRFCPVKRTATVSRGHVKMSVDHYPMKFRFRVNGNAGDGMGGESVLALPNGYKVLVAFHPGHFEEGCHVFNGEQGALNREKIRFGEFLCLAPVAADAPQLNFSSDKRDYGNAKKANASMRSETRSALASGKEGRKTSHARDGFGGSISRKNTEEPKTSHRRRESAPQIDDAKMAQIEANIARMEEEARERGDLPAVF